MKKVTPKTTTSIRAYEKAVGTDTMAELELASKPLQGLRIAEINATAVGGGVAELLNGQIPLARALGVLSDWYVLPPDEKFFKTTKGLHNCLQGQCALETVLDFEYYQQYHDSIAHSIPEADLYILHDPQTLGLVPFLKGKPVVWRCHIDLTQADPTSLDWLRKYYPYFQKVIFSLEAYVHGLEHSKVSIVHPAIDPLSDKNIELLGPQQHVALKKLKIDIKKPYILQVSRFDKFKDPLGVIRIYEQLRRKIPDLQCVLAGNYATDDPEGIEYYAMSQAKAQQVQGGGVHFVLGATDTQINALQQNAAIVIQNSTREGFGLTVTEALWKKKIVFSHPVGGIALQVINDRTGYYISDDTTQAIGIMSDVIDRPHIYAMIGLAAHEHVKRQFVLPVMLKDYFNTYSEALNS